MERPKWCTVGFSAPIMGEQWGLWTGLDEASIEPTRLVYPCQSKSYIRREGWRVCTCPGLLTWKPMESHGLVLTLHTIPVLCQEVGALQPEAWGLLHYQPVIYFLFDYTAAPRVSASCRVHLPLGAWLAPGQAWHTETPIMARSGMLRYGVGRSRARQADILIYGLPTCRGVTHCLQLTLYVFRGDRGRFHLGVGIVHLLGITWAAKKYEEAWVQLGDVFTYQWEWESI